MRRQYSTFLRRRVGELVDHGEADGLPTAELLVVPGHGLFWHLREQLDTGTRPRGEGGEGPPVGRELEQRAAVGTEELDQEPKSALDLFADPLDRQAGEACGEVDEKRLYLADVGRDHDPGCLGLRYFVNTHEILRLRGISTRNPPGP